MMDKDSLLLLQKEKTLQLWQRVCLAIVREQSFDLTTRQMVILLTIYLEPPPHTIRGLAKILGVTKPVITRALNALGEMDLVSRQRDVVDRRDVIIQRTASGAVFLQELNTRIKKQIACLANEVGEVKS